MKKKIRTKESAGKKTHDEEGRRAFVLSSLKKSHPPDRGFSDRQFYASFKLAATTNAGIQNPGQIRAFTRIAQRPVFGYDCRDYITQSLIDCRRMISFRASPPRIRAEAVDTILLKVTF